MTELKLSECVAVFITGKKVWLLYLTSLPTMFETSDIRHDLYVDERNI